MLPGLPADVADAVCEFLPVRDVASLSRACRGCSAGARGDDLWRALMRRDWGGGGSAGAVSAPLRGGAREAYAARLRRYREKCAAMVGEEAAAEASAARAAAAAHVGRHWALACVPREWWVHHDESTIRRLGALACAVAGWLPTAVCLHVPAFWRAVAWWVWAILLPVGVLALPFTGVLLRWGLPPPFQRVLPEWVRRRPASLVCSAVGGAVLVFHASCYWPYSWLRFVVFAARMIVRVSRISACLVCYGNAFGAMRAPTLGRGVAMLRPVLALTVCWTAVEGVLWLCGCQTWLHPPVFLGSLFTAWRGPLWLGMAAAAASKVWALVRRTRAQVSWRTLLSGVAFGCAAEVTLPLLGAAPTAATVWGHAAATLYFVLQTVHVVVAVAIWFVVPGLFVLGTALSPPNYAAASRAGSVLLLVLCWVLNAWTANTTYSVAHSAEMLGLS